MRCECFRFLERAVFRRPSAFSFVKKYSRIAGDGVPNSAGKFLCLGTPSPTTSEKFLYLATAAQTTSENFCASRRRRKQPQNFDAPRDDGASNLTKFLDLATTARATSEKIRTLRRRRRQHHKIFVENETHYFCHRVY